MPDAKSLRALGQLGQDDFSYGFFDAEFAPAQIPMVFGPRIDPSKIPLYMPGVGFFDGVNAIANGFIYFVPGNSSSDSGHYLTAVPLGTKLAKFDVSVASVAKEWLFTTPLDLTFVQSGRYKGVDRFDLTESGVDKVHA